MSVGFAKVIAMLSFLVTNILIARYLGPEGKGLTTIFTVVPSVVAVLAGIGLDKSTAYEIGKQNFPLDKILSALFVGSAGAVLLGLVISGGYFLLSWSPSYTWVNVELTMAVTAFVIIQQSLHGVLLGQRQIRSYSVTRWLPQAVQAGVILAFVVLAAVAVTDVITGMLAGFALGVAYSLAALARSIRWRFDFDMRCLRALLTYGAVASIADFLIFLNYKIQIFVLQAVSTVEQVGLFSLGQNFGELLWQLPSAMGAVILARSVTASDAGAFSEKLGGLLRLSLIVCAVIGIGIGGAIWIGIPYIFGEAFNPSTGVYLVLLPGVVAIIAFKILSVDLVGQGKARLTAMIMAPSIIANVLLGMLLIPAWGAIGAALAASLTYVAISAAVVMIYARETGQTVNALLAPRRSDLTALARRVPFLKRRFGGD